MTPALSIQNIAFSFDHQSILECASFIIQPGEFVGIFGPNGGGKTTLLKLLMGLYTPTKGTISLLGYPPIKMRPHIGYVPQTSKIDRLFPITAEEVVQMGCLSKLSSLGRLSPAVKERAQQALDQVGMQHKRHSPFGHLSGGEAQRVLIARALASDPYFLFLDEPTANIDPLAEEEIISLLTSLKGAITILMVTHDLPTILQKVEKLLCVHREVHLLAPSEVCEHYGLGLYHSPLMQTLQKKNS